jgi:hypothetical protein
MAMSTYEEASSRAAEMAIKKLKRDSVNVAGGREIVEDEKLKAQAGEARPIKNNGDDAIEETSLGGRNPSQQDED